MAPEEGGGLSAPCVTGAGTTRCVMGGPCAQRFVSWGRVCAQRVVSRGGLVRNALCHGGGPVRNALCHRVLGGSEPLYFGGDLTRLARTTPHPSGNRGYILAIGHGGGQFATPCVTEEGAQRLVSPWGGPVRNALCHPTGPCAQRLVLRGGACAHRLVSRNALFH